MADENIVVGITANSNFSDLVTDINKVTASLSRMQQTLVTTDKSFVNQVAKLNAAFSSALSSSGQFSTHFVSLQSDAEKFGKSLDSGKLKLRDYFNTLNTHIKTNGGLIRDLAKQQTALQNAVIQPLGKNAQGLMQYNIHVARGIDEVANKTKIAAQQAAIMNKVITQGANQLINWGKNTQWAGRQLTVGLTVPLAAFGKAAADAFNKADQELVRLTKVYGGLAATSAAELGKVRKDVSATAKELASAYGASYQDTLSLAADIAATGKTGNELLGSIKETTRLSVLGEVDRQDAMKATLAIQTAFKQNTEQLSGSINFLNAVENQTSTTLADLIEAIPKAGPVIKGLGGSVKDLALYLTAMKEGGITAAEGANALKSGLAALINPTNVAVNKFKSFGIDLLGIVNNNAGDVTGTLLALQSALDKLDPLKKQQAIEQLFGKFQFARMNALFENLGKQGSQTLQVLDLMKASSQDLANVAGRELAQVTESASGKYRRALESLKADLASVGDQFLTINTNLLKFIDGIVKFASNLPAPIKTIMGFLGGLTAIAGPLIMLTGVLGNFFGYVIKGVSHFRALFKGAEGWKLLTPEILAAQQAGSLMEKTFYDDSKAATVLKTSISNLINELSILEAKAHSGSMSVGPQMTAAAQAAMAAREVNPQHPLVGSPYTRASAHMVPRASMSQEQRASQTFFGMVPSSIPVNQRIGENPMVYSEGNLPPVSGLTTVDTKRGPVSTGILASEAAKWHSMNATLAMMSKAELAELKKNVMATGVATQAFTDTFESVLPAVTGITTNAAKESAAIVNKLRAGELTVEAARAEIVALNLRIEQELGQTATMIAGESGRSINLQKVPTLNQPVVDAAGKSNMRELFKKSSSRSFINKLAGVLGVRTSGAGYNVETTRLKKYNSGGYIYTANDGSIVPGPNVNADIVPAMLTPGEFVVNAQATAANLPLLQAINGKGSSGNRLNTGSSGPLSGLQRGHLSNDLSAFLMYMDSNTNQRFVRGRTYQGFDGITGLEIAESFSSLKRRTGMHPMSIMDNLVRRMGGDPRYVEQLYHSILKDLVNPENRNKVFGGVSGASFEDFADKHLSILKNSKLPNGSNVYDELKRIKTQRSGISGKGRSIGLTMDGNKYGRGNALLDTEGKPIMRALLGTSSGFKGDSIINKLLNFSLGPNPDKRGGSIESHGQSSTFLGMPFQRSKTGWATYGTLGNMFQEAMRSRMKFAPGAFRPIRRNRGGVIPGYVRGGKVAGMLGSMALGTAGYMAGSQIGQNVGGDAGSLIGGMIGSMAGSIPLTRMAKGGEEAAAGLGRLATISSRLPAILKGTFFGVSRLNIAIAGLTTAAVIGYKAYKNYQESQRLESLSFGMSADAAKKAGYQFTDYAQKMKDAIASAKALKERNVMLYESMTKSNTPLKMTIEQYKKLRSEVKSTMGDYIKLFDKTKNKDLLNTATDLKAQFIAMGDSAETATAKVYALLAQSNKAGMAGSIIGNKQFGLINDPTQAAARQGRRFTAAQEVGTAKSQADALFTTFQGIDNAISSALLKSEAAAKSGKGVAKTYQEVANSQINSITKSMGAQKNISANLIKEIAKQNPELAKILNSTDNIKTAWYKYKLVTEGVNVNLDKMSGKAAQALYNLKSITDQQTLAALKSDKTGIGAQYTQLNKYTAAIKALQKAAKGQSAQQQIDDKTTIKNLQKKIDLINKEADDKIKALNKVNDAENAQLEIQQAQLEYRQAVARGDRDAAAQAQIRIQQIVKERQLKTAEDSIRANAEAKTTPLQAKIDAINAKQDKLGDAAALAGDKLGALQGKADTLSGKLGDLSTAVEAAALYMETHGGKKDPNQVAAVQSYLDSLFGKGKKSASSLLDTIATSLEKNPIVADAVTIYTKELKESKGVKADVNKTTQFPNTPGEINNYSIPYSKLPAGTSQAIGTVFTASDGKKYKITGGADRSGSIPLIPVRGTGGGVVGNSPYVVGERGPELFIPSFSGSIIPNNKLTAMYNLPNTGWSLSGSSSSNNMMSNNTYNVKIELNGTNLSADDVYNKFEQKLAMLNAKQGRNKTIGGI